MTAARSIKVRGKVQGVNFRYYTRQEAIRLSLCGTVENQDDGSVLIRVEGEPEKLNALLNWCKKGPLLARVDHLEVEEVPLQGFSQFMIIR